MSGITDLWHRLSPTHRRLQRWRDAVEPCQLSEVETGLDLRGRETLTAQSGPNAVRITRGTGEDVVVEIEGPEGFSVVKLRHQGFQSTPYEIQIGDKPFDDQFIIEGPDRSVAARLDETMRRLLVRATVYSTSLKIGGGKLQAQAAEGSLFDILPILLDIGRRMAEPVDVERRIAENARRDPSPGVRIFNMLLLVRERPGDPDTLEVLRDACSDEIPEVRLRAAMARGARGRGTLLQLVQSSSDDAACARAVAQQGRALSFESLHEILDCALQVLYSRGGRLLRTACACLDELGHRKAAAVSLLARTMVEQEGELAITAARALGTTGEAAAEPHLLQALAREDEKLRKAAAIALGRVGTAAAVQPLQEAAEHSSRLALSGLRWAAQQSIAKIQSRLQGAAPGQLSLAATDAGQLSLAEADAGQLALAQDEAGQLALAADSAGQLSHAQDEIPLLPHAADEPEQPSHNARETPGRPSRPASARQG